MGWFRKNKEEKATDDDIPHSKGFFSTDLPALTGSASDRLVKALAQSFQRTVKEHGGFDRSGKAMAMDDSALATKTLYQKFQAPIPEAQVAWYGSQGFIGYPVCAMISQNWLVDKACTMPAKDAIRNGYTTNVADGAEVDPEVLTDLKKMDERFNLNENLLQYIRMGRVYGIRICMFLVDSSDPDYYLNPFNPDGVQPGSYRGMSQIDPYWISPELDMESSSNPASPNFYEPTWWRVNGQRIHRSHLVIFKTNEVPDLLKPAYLYGGVSIPQKIYERVYAAERTANEAPMLAMTKRLTVLNLDMTQVTADPAAFEENMRQWVALRDNYGVKVIGGDESIMQFDTSLNDLDMTIMTQYQLVAAASNVPATKLLGTTPKGFNSTGEYEEASYHEELESIQAHDLTPLIQRHHLLCIRSELAPEYGIEPFMTEVSWAPLDSMTAKELAETNLIKAQTGNALVTAGAIDAIDERQRLIDDPESGYVNLAMQDPLDQIIDDPLLGDLGLTDEGGGIA